MTVATWLQLPWLLAALFQSGGGFTLEFTSEFTSELPASGEKAAIRWARLIRVVTAFLSCLAAPWLYYLVASLRRIGG